jgi:hypothetical protein
MPQFCGLHAHAPRLALLSVLRPGTALLPLCIPHITSPSRSFSTSFYPDNQSTGILLRALESPGNDEYLSFQKLSRSLAKSDLVPEAERT